MDKYIGKKYNELTIIKYEYTDKIYHKYYLCECECGNKKIININNIKTGRTKSCGCNYKEVLGNLYKKVNNYDIKDNYVVGYTTNTNKRFYVDLEDYEKIKNISKGKPIMTLHRFLMKPPNDKVIDHINHNKKDNRKINLRIVTQKENILNKKNVPKGINKHKVGNKEYFMIQLNGYRGNFKTYQEAKKVRDEIIKKEYIIIKKD